MGQGASSAAYFQAAVPLTLDHLRRTCDQPEGLPTDVALQVLADFERYVRAGGAIDLDQAFGLCGASGSRPWHVRLARERALAVLRELGALLGGNASQRADAIGRALRKHRPAWLRRDTLGLDDPAKRMVFAALTLDDTIPDSFERLRKLLGDASD